MSYTVTCQNHLAESIPMLHPMQGFLLAAKMPTAVYSLLQKALGLLCSVKFDDFAHSQLQD